MRNITGHQRGTLRKVAVALIALLCGCILPTPPTPAPTQTASPVPPTLTPSPSPTWTPSPTPTPVFTPTPSPTPAPICAIEWTWRDLGLVVTAVDFTRLDGLVPGDVILTIDGRSAEEVIIEAELNFGNIGDPALRRQAALDYILLSHHVLVLRVRHQQEPPYYFNLRPDCHS